MSRSESYGKEYDKAEQFFRKQIQDRVAKAFEYGTLVVRNALLVSGCALLAIPALVGLASEITVDVGEASRAGVLFAFSLVILGAYVIHINWSLHAAAWEKHWEDRQSFLKNYYLDELEYDQAVTGRSNPYGRAITATFWLPHILAVSYLTTISLGFLSLYTSFGI